MLRRTSSGASDQENGHRKRVISIDPFLCRIWSFHEQATDKDAVIAMEIENSAALPTVPADHRVGVALPAANTIRAFAA